MYELGNYDHQKTIKNYLLDCFLERRNAFILLRFYESLSPSAKEKKKPKIFAHVYLVSSATLNVNLVDAIFIKHYILFIWLVVNIYFPFFLEAIRAILRSWSHALEMSLCYRQNFSHSWNLHSVLSNFCDSFKAALPREVPKRE